MEDTATKAPMLCEPSDDTPPVGAEGGGGDGGGAPVIWAHGLEATGYPRSTFAALAAGVRVGGLLALQVPAAGVAGSIYVLAQRLRGRRVRAFDEATLHLWGHQEGLVLRIMARPQAARLYAIFERLTPARPRKTTTRRRGC